MIGIVKDNMDSDGIRIFQERYFPFPLYEDKRKIFYSKLGNRKIFQNIEWNFFKALNVMSRLRKRLRMKGDIAGNFRGEGLLQGGVVLFSRKDGVVYQHNECTGEEIPIEEIETQINQYSK